jgi:hypothetical protein
MGDMKFYNLDSLGDPSIYNEHMDNCVCCGGKTQEMSGELSSDYNQTYRCDVCDTRICNFGNKIEVYVEKQRARSILKDKYSQYDWPKF